MSSYETEAFADVEDEDESEGTTERDMEEMLSAVLEFGDEFDEFENLRCATFSDVGLLTSNNGIVITLANGDEFQLTIVKR